VLVEQDGKGVEEIAVSILLLYLTCYYETVKQ